MPEKQTVYGVVRCRCESCQERNKQRYGIDVVVIKDEEFQHPDTMSFEELVDHARVSTKKEAINLAEVLAKLENVKTCEFERSRRSRIDRWKDELLLERVGL